MSRKAYTSIFLAAFLLFPFNAFATPEYIDCSWFSSFNGVASCNSGTLTLGNNQNVDYASTDGHATILDSTTYYMTFVSDSTNDVKIEMSGNDNFCGSNIVNATTGENSISLTSCSNSDAGWINFTSNGGAIELSDICISTTPGECNSTPPTPDIGTQIDIFLEYIDGDYSLSFVNCASFATLIGSGINIYVGTSTESLEEQVAMNTTGQNGFTSSGHDCSTNWVFGTYADGVKLVSTSTNATVYYPLTSLPDGQYFWTFRNASTGDYAGYYLAFSVSDGIPTPTPSVNNSFNEVDHYIPSTGVSTSTGITTVGAVFNISNTSSVEYVGYRIISPNNEVVYNSTSTVPFSGIYPISTNFDFNTAGIYTGHAYFAQIVGNNVWEIDNPSIQQIGVGVENWTVNPDGTFTQNPATTSTTTLPNLSIDCGTGFAGSMCNLAAKLLFPQAKSIQRLQSAFAALMNRAPFSFFTQSKTLLNSIHSVAFTDQTLSLNLFGSTTQILSASTTSSIGITTSVIDFTKFIEATGLWILLAWYFYWRVGTIFHIV